MKDVEYWKSKGFAFEKRSLGEYDLWVNRVTMQRLRRYISGTEWLSNLDTGKYEVVPE